MSSEAGTIQALIPELEQALVRLRKNNLSEIEQQDLASHLDDMFDKRNKFNAALDEKPLPLALRQRIEQAGRDHIPLEPSPRSRRRPTAGTLSGRTR